MRIITTLLLAAFVSSAALAQVPTVSNIRFDGVSHSVLRATFAASAPFYWLRTRYVQSPATCTGGTGGDVQGSSYGPANARALRAGDGNTLVLGGLNAGTTYQICPEISADFVNWSSGVGATVTTLQLPEEHPAKPLKPVTFNTDYPLTSGYNNVTVASDCSNFLSLFSSAVQNQQSNGTVINIPPGTACTGPYSLGQRAPDATVFSSSSVSSVSNSISVGNHGITEGQGLIFGTSYGCLPGSLTNLNGGDCHKFGPLIAGQLYYAHPIDANNFQLYAGAPKNSGGVLVLMPDGGYGTEFFVKWPRPLKWIIIRTSTPDVQFTPEHVRVTPQWAPKMGILRSPPYAMAGSVAANSLMVVGDFDGNNMSMVANVRFVGLEFTYAGNSAVNTSSDPLPWFTLLSTPPTAQNVVVDRCYFHGLGSPNRVYNAVSWDGMNVAIIDSYLDNLEYFHSVYSGLGLTKVN